MANHPSLTITALGHRGSGKTTFLLGMYADLSGGRKGYFLNAPDPDMDLDLARKWDKLLDDGELPPANLANNIRYSFLFLDGARPLLGVNWIDYRGGALADDQGAESQDVPGLHERLNESDSIYLVIDGGYLIEPVTTSNRSGIMRDAGLRRMTSLLQNAVQSRAAADSPRPSIVILITKADVIPRQRFASLGSLVDDVQSLLGLCFTEGFSTMICPVMLGYFGLEPKERVNQGDIAPRYLHLPIIYSLAEYMHQVSVAAGSAASASAQHQRELETQLAGLRAGAGPFLRRSAISAIDKRRADAASQSANMTEVQQYAAKRAEGLFGELAGLPIFRDGQEVSV